jgi:tetratricopeptide (TPR) repeat protein
MRRSLYTTALALAVAFLMVSATGCTKLRARDQLNKGVQAFTNAQYPEAVDHFKKSIELDPEFKTARLYLATAYMSQYIPGADSPENVEMARTALDEFQKVLESDPTDTVAIMSIASLHFHQNQFDQAEDWYHKLIEIDPQNKEAYYTLGVIAWTRSFQPRMEARAEMGMKPEDPGPLRDTTVRNKLREELLPVVDTGLKDLQKAIEIDPQYDDAMAYLNLLHRERADLMDTKEEYDAEIAQADNWVDKTLETKKIKAARTQSVEAIGVTDE